MTPAAHTGILVIGVGNAYRSDDGIGLVVARRLKERAMDSCRVLEHSGEGTGLLEAWRGAETVFLVDAILSGAAPGTVHRFDAARAALPRQLFRASTHAFSIAEAVELGRALSQIPRRLVVYGVEGKNFDAGTELSPEVEKAVPHVIARLLEDIAAASPATNRMD